MYWEKMGKKGQQAGIFRMRNDIIKTLEKAEDGPEDPFALFEQWMEDAASSFGKGEIKGGLFLHYPRKCS